MSPWVTGKVWASPKFQTLHLPYWTSSLNNPKSAPISAQRQATMTSRRRASSVTSKSTETSMIPPPPSDQHVVSRYEVVSSFAIIQVANMLVINKFNWFPQHWYFRSDLFKGFITFLRFWTTNQCSPTKFMFFRDFTPYFASNLEFTGGTLTPLWGGLKPLWWSE